MRIGLIGQNSVEYINNILHIWNNHDSIVLIDPSTPPKVAQELLKETHASLCLIEECFSPAFDSIKTEKDIVYSTTYQMPSLFPDVSRALFRVRYDNTEAVVINSSGTTGKCKGISLSHRAIQNNADSIIAYMNPSPADCFYLNKKLVHSSSLVGELLVALKSGASIVLSQTAIPPRIAFQNISDFHVSILCCNPTLLRFYMDEVNRTASFPQSVRVIYTSGELISKKEIETARRTFGCPVYNVYGQTECGPRISAQRADSCSGNSVGKPVANVSVQISNNGEILVKTNARFSSYVNTGVLNEEWHKTGDLGMIDKNGELFVTGRIDTMLTLNAHNIFPEKIEAVIIENSSAKDCIVKKEDGRLICCYVAEYPLTPTEKTKLRRLLMPYEIPSIFKKVDAIPKNGNGKKIRNTQKGDHHGA